MIARKTQKIIYNILILCFLIGGATYVCSRFILGNIEYTDNAQVKQHITPIIPVYRDLSRRYALKNISRYEKVIRSLLLKMRNSVFV